MSSVCHGKDGLAICHFISHPGRNILRNNLGAAARLLLSLLPVSESRRGEKVVNLPPNRAFMQPI